MSLAEDVASLRAGVDSEQNGEEVKKEKDEDGVGPANLDVLPQKPGLAYSDEVEEDDYDAD